MGVVRLAKPEDAHLILAADDLFDLPPNASYLNEFLEDPRHHLLVAWNGARPIGFLSAVHYIHPDKAPQMWINELGVADAYRRRGLATELVAELIPLARDLRCSEIWVLSDPTPEALGFYASLNWDKTGDNIAMFSTDLGHG